MFKKKDEKKPEKEQPGGALGEAKRPADVVPKEINEITLDEFRKLMADDRTITSVLIFRGADYTEIRAIGNEVHRYKTGQKDMPQFEKALEGANFKRINTLEDIRVWHPVKAEI